MISTATCGANLSTNCNKCSFTYACDTSNGWCDLSTTSCTTPDVCQDISTPAGSSQCGECITPDPCTTACTQDTDCDTTSTGSGTWTRTGKCVPNTADPNNCNVCDYSTPAPTETPCDECDTATIANDCIDNNVPIGQTVTATCIIPDPSTNCKKCDFAYACDTSNGWCDLSVIPSTCIAPQECQQISGGNSQCGECITSNTCVDECDPVTITNDCIDNNVPTGQTVTAICELDTTTNCKQCSFSYACEYCDLNALLSTCTAPKICMSAIFSSTSNSCGECKDPCENQPCTQDSDCTTGTSAGGNSIAKKCVEDTTDTYKCNICQDILTPTTTETTLCSGATECLINSDCDNSVTGIYVCIGATTTTCGECKDCSQQACDNSNDCNTDSSWTGTADFICEQDTDVSTTTYGCNICKQTRCIDYSIGECLTDDNCENNQECDGATYTACGTCVDKPTTTTSVSCTDNEDCDADYSCQFTTWNCVPGSSTLTSNTAITAYDTCEGVCVADSDYCDGITAVNPSFYVSNVNSGGVAVDLTTATGPDLRGLCEFCLCTPNGDVMRKCQYIDDIVSWFWDITQDEFETIFADICNYQTYKDLSYTDQSGIIGQCPYEFVRAKSTTQFENCWCDALYCEVVNGPAASGNQLGYMVGIVLVVGIFSWM
eukprot:226329_1